MKFTLGQAAKEASVSKPTLSRAVKSGQLSAAKRSDGAYEIDASELYRWLEGYRSRNPQETVSDKDKETPEMPAETGALEAELEAMRQQLEAERSERAREREQLNDHIQDLRRQLDRSDERVTRLLTDQRPAPAPRRWWPFGKTSSA